MEFLRVGTVWLQDRLNKSFLILVCSVSLQIHPKTDSYTLYDSSFSTPVNSKTLLSMQHAETVIHWYLLMLIRDL